MNFGHVLIAAQRAQVPHTLIDSELLLLRFASDVHVLTERVLARASRELATPILDENSDPKMLALALESLPRTATIVTADLLRVVRTWAKSPRTPGQMSEKIPLTVSPEHLNTLKGSHAEVGSLAPRSAGAMRIVSATALLAPDSDRPAPLTSVSVEELRLWGPGLDQLRVTPQFDSPPSHSLRTSMVKQVDAAAVTDALLLLDL